MKIKLENKKFHQQSGEMHNSRMSKFKLLDQVTDKDGFICEADSQSDFTFGTSAFTFGSVDFYMKI